MKKTFELRKFTPGLVTDVSENSNGGLVDIANLSINYMGKLVKRKGWDVVTAYGEVTPNVGNIDIFYDGERPDILHVNATIENGKTYRDVILLYSDLTRLVIRRYNENGDFIFEKQIADEINWLKRSGPVTFIKTNDQIYIINGYREGEDTGTVFKYNFGINNKALDADKLQNISLQEMVHETADLNYEDAGPNIKLTSGATYFYKISPIYVTSSEGKAALIKNSETSWGAGIYTGSQETYKDPTTGEIKSNPYRPPIKVNIKIKSTYDPYITAYKIYRTKGIKSIAPGITPGYIPDDQAEDFDYYFLAQVDAPDNLTDPSAWITLYTDKIRDIELGSIFTEINPLNNYKHSPAPNPSVLPATKTQDGIGMQAVTGIYHNNVLVLCGKYSQSDKIYVSEFDKTDTFVAEKVYRAPLLNKNNPATAILGVGQNIFIFGKSVLYALRPTASEDVPYSLELISTHLGVDSPRSVISLREIGYFIFNDMLYSISEYGEIKPMSQAFNNELKKFTRRAGSSMPLNILLYGNNKERSILMVIFREDNPPLNIWIYPEKGFITTNRGYRDIYKRTQNLYGTQIIVEPKAKDERYTLVSYYYNRDINEEWGITYDGDIVKRSDNYMDYSRITDINTWPGFINQGDILNTVDYVVEGLIEKAWSFPSTILVNSVIIYGNGKLWIAVSYDNNEYSDWTEITMDRTGVEIPLNGYCRLLKFKLKHTENNDIDIDYFKFKLDVDKKLDIEALTSGGS